jgi:DnaJ domain/Tetratricopeptide repeat
LSSDTDRTQHDALAEPVDLPMERKREILAREALLGRDHWTVLGLKPGAGADAVQAAYFEASKLFHPDRYYGKNLGSYQARLERIFHRLSDAHEALSEALKQVRTSAPSSSSDGGSGAVDRQRSDERKARLARHPYLVKGARAAAMLSEAQRQLQAASPGKALGLLAKAQALGGVKNGQGPALEAEAKRLQNVQRAEEEMQRGRSAVDSRDIAIAVAAFGRAAALDPTRADASYEAARWIVHSGGKLAEARTLAQRAVELRQDHLPSHLLLAEICIKMGMGSVARRYLEAVLERDPRNAEARALLRQVR